jgi:hypothetical protein
VATTSEICEDARQAMEGEKGTRGGQKGHKDVQGEL